MASPAKLAHVALRTPDIGKMRDWYNTVLEGEVVFENDFACFTTYDDEHHRVVFMAAPELLTSPQGPSRLQHVSFTFAKFDELIDTYERLHHKGIDPVLTLNHGPTFSYYYADPDGNNVELQIDTMTMAKAREFVDSELFAANPIGIPFDAADVLSRYRAGESEAELTRYGT